MAPIDGYKKMLAAGGGGAMVIPALHELGMPDIVLMLTAGVIGLYLLVQGAVDIVKAWAAAKAGKAKK